jgi:hypothetical protein
LQIVVEKEFARKVGLIARSCVMPKDDSRCCGNATSVALVQLLRMIDKLGGNHGFREK